MSSRVYADGDPVAVGVSVACHVVDWCVAHPLDAHMLTGLSMDDLTEDKVPADVVERGRAIRHQQRRAIEHLATRLDLPVDQVIFAVAGIPYTAVRRAAGNGNTIPGGPRKPWLVPAVPY